jgi:hypothetical protein
MLKVGAPALCLDRIIIVASGTCTVAPIGNGYVSGSLGSRSFDAPEAFGVMSRSLPTPLWLEAVTDCEVYLLTMRTAQILFRLDFELYKAVFDLAQARVQLFQTPTPTPVDLAGAGDTAAAEENADPKSNDTMEAALTLSGICKRAKLSHAP